MVRSELTSADSARAPGVSRPRGPALPLVRRMARPVRGTAAVASAVLVVVALLALAEIAGEEHPLGAVRIAAGLALGAVMGLAGWAAFLVTEE